MGIVSYRMAQALRSGVGLALLAELEHPNGMQRFWTGIGPLSYDGATWVGAGRLGNVTQVKYNSDLAIQEVMFTLSGVDSADLKWLKSDVRGGLAACWLAAIQNGAVVSDPLQILDAELDVQSHKIEADGSATISITARSGFWSLERELDEVWSPTDQKKRFPKDVGLDMIPELQNQEVKWAPA